VQVQKLAGRRSQGGRISQQLLDLRPQSPDRTALHEPAPPLRDLRAKFMAASIAQLPQLPLQVDKGHGGAPAGSARAGDRWAEVVDQTAHRFLGILVGHQGRAGGGEATRQPQQQQWLVGHALVADLRPSQPRQLAQEVWTVHGVSR
jgi:hypothetical protein